MAILLSLAGSLKAAGRGFAIIIDTPTYNACKSSVDNYRLMLAGEGFDARIFAQNWDSPQEIRDLLQSLYRNENLEGAIFIGQIPIPMIRDAQHFTSAFKMDQERYPFSQSSVPSDRYYDDFDLRFDLLGRDTTNKLFHYYSLRWDSPQKISCDIYTGRLKPVRNGEEGYAQIRAYFDKLLKERKSGNLMDVFVSYTGEGSFSNSMTAWKEEAVTAREQFPDAFKDLNSAKFLFFDMYPYMKQTVIEELQREDVDLMIFHEHGTPDRQYLTGIPLSKGIQENTDAAKKIFRQKLRKAGATSEKLPLMKQRWMEYYRIDSTWFAGAFDQEQIIKDSVQDANMGILLDDVPRIKPNPRVVIFDACYNGDFREERYIAGEYVFAEGKTLVAIGNSVNVLQDKSSSDLLGLLSLGYSVGEWARITNILESHIIGDPTFCFAIPDAKKRENPADFVKADLKSESIPYWTGFFDKAQHPDLKGLALHRLFALKYQDLPQLLLDTYKSSPYYMLRLQTFHLLQFYNNGMFEQMLKISVKDPYEFIRRKSVNAMGRNGNDEFIPYVVDSWIHEFLDERIKFNAEFSFDLFNMEAVEKYAKAKIEEDKQIFDKASKLEEFEKTFASRKRLSQMASEVPDKEIKLSSRLMGVSSLRNNNYHKNIDRYLSVLSDSNEDLNLRVKLAEALGWFVYSSGRGEIAKTCKEIAGLNETPEVLRKELLKTVKRVEEYMRQGETGAPVKAEQKVLTTAGKYYSKFLIVIDSQTYYDVREEVDAYKNQLETEGLRVVLLTGEWDSPEPLREQIRKIYNKKPVLEGAVFIGKIPIVRVRNFQHATTAFKMDEGKFPMFESSVTSDRYYDDLDLEFEFIERDKDNPNLFYYKLKENSPQIVRSDFYSARMLPPSDKGAESAELLKTYLRKVILAHKENNPADRFITFNGHGYNSDCLTAWQNEQFYMREVMPLSFISSDGNAFYNFRQNPWMKFSLYEKMQKEGTDIFIFHEHGDWDTQYINGDYPAENMLEYTAEEPPGESYSVSSVKGPLTVGSAAIRNTYRRYNGERKESYKRSMTEDYGFEESFFDSVLLENTRSEDSLFAANINIKLNDLESVKMQPRLSIFDACYNGSFHRPGYIAGYHVFGDGQTIVAQGNTVNVLQDKWSLELLGMVAEGARIGFWQREFPYLESHLIGDPTLKFSSRGSEELNRALANREKSGKIWENYLNSENPNLQSLAVKMLPIYYKGDIPKKLFEIFSENKNYSVRMEALQRLYDYPGDYTVKAILAALNDPYELIRRNAARYAGFSGAEELIPPLVNTVLFSNESQRVQYSAQSALQMFDPELVLGEISLQGKNLKGVLKEENIAENITGYFKKEFARQENSLKLILDQKAPVTDRISAIRSLRNYNNHYQVSELVKVLEDPSEKTEVRIILAEALGWFRLSIKKEEILSSARKLYDNPGTDPLLKAELMQTIIRLSGK